MKKILFVCHGNICRSPMAEFIMKKMISDMGRSQDFYIESAAVSREEIGNDMHYGAKEKLQQKGIPFERRAARQITKEDYKNFDLLIGMDINNMYRMEKFWDNDPDSKVKLLLTYAGKDRDIADPWYTGNFDDTWRDLNEGIRALLEKI